MLTLTSGGLPAMVFSNLTRMTWSEPNFSTSRTMGSKMRVMVALKLECEKLEVRTSMFQVRWTYPESVIEFLTSPAALLFFSPAMGKLTYLSESPRPRNPGLS